MRAGLIFIVVALAGCAASRTDSLYCFGMCWNIQHDKETAPATVADVVEKVTQ